MKKLKINQFAYSELVASGIGERNTVSNGPDNGSNNMMASHFWNVKRHGSTVEAIDNALINVSITATPKSPTTFNSPGGCNIGGHGNEGLLETGMGQTGPFNVNQLIYSYNESTWGPQLERLIPTPITMISIWSCHTGAGSDGAQLLFAMAKRAGRAVRGRTGFTYNNSQQTWFENGSVWQVATPDYEPNPIAAPSPHNVIFSEVPMFQGAMQEYQTSDIIEVQLIQVGLGQKSMLTQTIDKLDAQTVVEMLFIGPALEMDATVSGMITANVSIKFDSGEILEFVIYNDRLAVNHAYATAYYLKGGLNILFQST